MPHVLLFPVLHLFLNILFIITNCETVRHHSLFTHSLTHPSDPRGEQYGQHCNYQLIKYKQWNGKPSNIRGDLPNTDAICTDAYHNFLCTHAPAPIPVLYQADYKPPNGCTRWIWQFMLIHHSSVVTPTVYLCLQFHLIVDAYHALQLWFAITIHNSWIKGQSRISRRINFCCTFMP